MRIDVRESREFRATIYALRAIDKTIAKMVRRETKRIAAPEWKEALSRRADSQIERVVLVDTAVISVSNQNVRAQSAGKGRPRSGGLAPKVDFPAVEFGVNQNKTINYRRKSRGGGTHTVSRRLGPTLKPRNPRGYVFYPAAREMIPRLAALWIQTTVRTIAEALEGKQE
jgi:hypothetical protein